MPGIKIALIDDHRLLTEAMRTILLTCEDVSEVTLFNNALQFSRTARASDYDLLLLDLIMPEMSGMQLLEQIRGAGNHSTRIIVLSSIADVQTIKMAIRKGADAFLFKSVQVEELLLAVRTVCAGERYIAEELRKSLVSHLFVEDQIVFQLSPREKDILQFVCSGRTIKEIAHELGLSAHTVQYYHRNVMKKLNVKRTADLIVFAMRNGLYASDVNTSE